VVVSFERCLPTPPYIYFWNSPYQTHNSLIIEDPRSPGTSFGMLLYTMSNMVYELNVWITVTIKEGFLNINFDYFQLINVCLWLFRWLIAFLSDCPSLYLSELYFFQISGTKILYPCVLIKVSHLKIISLTNLWRCQSLLGQLHNLFFNILWSKLQPLQKIHS
jgi:hypothetical protein